MDPHLKQTDSALRTPVARPAPPHGSAIFERAPGEILPDMHDTAVITGGLAGAFYNCGTDRLQRGELEVALERRQLFAHDVGLKSAEVGVAKNTLQGLPG